jgi:hypothetical protein
MVDSLELTLQNGKLQLHGWPNAILSKRKPHTVTPHAINKSVIYQKKGLVHVSHWLRKDRVTSSPVCATSHAYKHH